MALLAIVDHAWLMRIASRRHSPLARVVVLLVGAAILTGCNASSDQPLEDINLTVPVPWAARDAEGTMTGGIEQANVSVGDDGTVGYSVDLSGQAAQGAGAQWQAASANAAAVGTLYSGVDPATVGVRFLVTGPIDGQSGGAMLAVGVLSALQHQAILPHTTMTGTVLPDGAVGRVSGVPTKIRAAAQAGFQTVLIPLENARAGDTSTDGATDMRTYGQKLGVNVIPVRDLLQAYSILVGRSLIPAAARLPELSPPTELQSQRLATQLVAATDALQVRSRASINRRMSAQAKAKISAAKSELTRKEWIRAYATASTTYRELTEQLAEAATRERLAAVGRAKTSAEVATSAEQALGRAVTLENAVTSDPSMDGAEHLAVATALSPVATAKVVLRRVGDSVTRAGNDAAVLAAAVAVAQSAATADTFVPDQFAMAKATSTANGDEPSPSTFMTGYTTFLTQAATANLGVARSSVEANREQVPDDFEALALELKKLTQAHPVEDEGLAEETKQLGSAIAYYTTTVALPAVLDSQLFGSAAGQARSPGLRQGAQEAVASAHGVAAAFTADLSAQGVDPSFSVWLSKVADETSSSAIASDATNASGRAVIEAWNSVITSQTTRAYSQLKSP